MFSRHHPQVALLRARLQPLGITPRYDVLERVIRTVGDVDLAVTALLLSPRPAWLVEIAGPPK